MDRTSSFFNFKIRLSQKTPLSMCILQRLMLLKNINSVNPLFPTWLLQERGYAFKVPFSTCPEATYLINIAKYLSIQLLALELKWDATAPPPPSSNQDYVSPYPYELCAVFSSAHLLYAFCTKAKPCNCFIFVWSRCFLVLESLKYSKTF